MDVKLLERTPAEKRSPVKKAIIGDSSDPTVTFKNGDILRELNSTFTGKALPGPSNVQLKKGNCPLQRRPAGPPHSKRHLVNS